MEKYRMVYDLLEDEESKDTYIEKLNFLITHKRNYIDNIVEKYLPELANEKKDIYSEICLKFPNKKIVLWGAGNDGLMFLDYWKEKEKYECFCDSDENKQKYGFNGEKVISPRELYTSYSDRVIVIMTTRCGKEVEALLLEHGIDRECIFRMTQYTNLLSPKQYFEEPFLKWNREEYFVDAGAYDLNETIKFQNETSGIVRKIYAFEPDDINYQLCKMRMEKENLKNIELLHYGCWSKKEMLQFTMASRSSCIDEIGTVTVPVISIDEVVDTEVTFIKMDIEGAELEALKGAKETIKNNKPNLAICIYHKPEDMTEIPLYIKSLVPEYKFYIRHYTTYSDETVLYAVL